MYLYVNTRIYIIRERLVITVQYVLKIETTIDVVNISTIRSLSYSSFKSTQ